MWAQAKLRCTSGGSVGFGTIWSISAWNSFTLAAYCALSWANLAEVSANEPPPPPKLMSPPPPPPPRLSCCGLAVCCCCCGLAGAAVGLGAAVGWGALPRARSNWANSSNSFRVAASIATSVSNVLAGAAACCNFCCANCCSNCWIWSSNSCISWAIFSARW